LKISLNWLSDYVTWTGTTDELAHRLTLSGLNVEGVESFDISFPKVVVAEVITREQHPDADKLSLCTVDDGEEIKQVVCGAPNVRVGLKVLFAQVGAKLPGDFKIKKSKIRGVESFGMICSASELELSDESSGIMELDDDAVVGTPADDLYGYHDEVLDVEVTPNRPDWLSHYGVAREVSALQSSLLDTPVVWNPPKIGGESPEIHVEIDDFEDCPRYTAHLAREITVKPSPRWMQNRLAAVGVRPINNVVDITNYVLMEVGQPLHAFDRNKIVGQKLTVRRGRPNETLRTLDDTERKVGPKDLLIADASGPVALAGVMGGLLSEVDAETSSVLLESAIFKPRLVRTTSRHMQLSSEASYRFERGADWEAVDLAAKRAMYLLHEHAGAQISTAVVDRQDPDRRDVDPVTLRVQQANRLLGTDLTATAIVGHLQSIGLKCQPLGQASDRDSRTGRLMVKVPSFRRDIFKEVDLIEEVARLFGFDNINSTTGFRAATSVAVRPIDRMLGGVRRMMAAVGYHEIVTSSFMERSDTDLLGLADDDMRRDMLSIDNPHHGGETLLRTSITPSILHVARRNLNADREAPFRLFQLGREFLPSGRKRQDVRHENEKLLPEEPQILQAAVIGREGACYGGLPVGLMELKGLFEAFLERTRLSLVLDPTGAEPYFAAGLQWRILDEQGEAVGRLGSVGPSVLRGFDIDTCVEILEIDLARLNLSGEPTRYKAFPRYPTVKRDLSLVVPDAVTFADIAALVKTSGGPLLAACELFDHFRGESLGEGCSALGIRLKFQSAKGNLKGKAVDRAIATITSSLEGELGVALRS
jgi:phenylalanyl-tRNA synthetase beta chain